MYESGSQRPLMAVYGGELMILQAGFKIWLAKI